MAQVDANGVQIEYESFGSPENETVLLVMGFGAQMTLWPVELCEELVRRGYHVVRYDNRDCGLSQKFSELGQPDMGAMMTALMEGKPVEAPYTLDDMAADGMNLLTALGIEKAHIAGASMGGMIVQTMAANHPDRVLSVTSIMSTTGNPEVPQGKPEAMAALTTPLPENAGIDDIVAQGLTVWRLSRSPKFHDDEERIRARTERDAKRSFFPEGTTRQMAAIVASGDRRPKLKTLKMPAVVLHGTDDALIPVEGGKDTAANIPGADLRIVEGMGHDCPLALVDTFADAITAAAARASGNSQAAE